MLVLFYFVMLGASSYSLKHLAWLGLGCIWAERKRASFEGRMETNTERGKGKGKRKRQERKNVCYLEGTLLFFAEEDYNPFFSNAIVLCASPCFCYRACLQLLLLPFLSHDPFALLYSFTFYFSKTHFPSSHFFVFLANNLFFAFHACMRACMMTTQTDKQAGRQQKKDIGIGIGI